MIFLGPRSEIVSDLCRWISKHIYIYLCNIVQYIQIFISFTIQQLCPPHGCIQLPIDDRLHLIKIISTQSMHPSIISGDRKFTWYHRICIMISHLIRRSTVLLMSMCMNTCMLLSILNVYIYAVANHMVVRVYCIWYEYVHAEYSKYWYIVVYMYTIYIYI